jgi:hypothetical protein
VFLLNNENVKIIECPWKLAVIDNVLPIEIADYLRDHFPRGDTERLKDFFQHSGPANMDNPIFEQFFMENWISRDEIHRRAHEILDIPTPEDSAPTRWNYTYFPAGNPTETIRDWHVDLEDKKVQYILYLGHTSMETTLECGEKGKAHYSMPFIHNRLVFWHATDTSWHRFFYCNKDRFTVNLTSQMTWSKTNYVGLEDYVS